MGGPKLSAAQMAQRRQTMLRVAFRLFAKKNIDSVSMRDIAAKSNCGLRTIHRYFNTKDELVVAVSSWAFDKFITENRKRRRKDLSQTTAAEDYEFFLDSFLALYRKHADLLRFNQMFNVYVRSEHISEEKMQPYQEIMNALRERFHNTYEKRDGTLRTNVPEEEIFSTTLHLMLAVVTRYAVGLVYQGGTDPERELLTQKEMLLRQYTIQ